MKKKVISIIVFSLLGITLIGLLVVGIMSCTHKDENDEPPVEAETTVPTTTPTDTTKPTEGGNQESTSPGNPEIIDGGYYPSSKFNAEKHLKVIYLAKGGLATDKNHLGLTGIERNKYITAGCFQGLMNRNIVEYYVDYPIMKSGVSTSRYWLDEIVKEYDITTEEITFEEMIGEYKDTFADKAGYILYDDFTDPNIGEDYTRSITAACNMAAIRNWLPVSKSIEEEVKRLGLEKKLDVCDKTEKWVFEKYKDEFDNSILIQQRPMEIPGMPMVPLRDYGCQNKFFTFFEPGRSQGDMKFREAVHKWAKQDTPMLGWGPGDEGGHISFATRYGQFPVPSDFSMNLSVFNADIFRTQNLKQKNDFTPITPEKGKHYVAFGRSDGDNISVWANEFPLSPGDFGSQNKGDFPMSWSIQPSLIDIAPGMMNIIYKQALENKDYFICPVSGHGYMYPSTYPNEKRKDWLNKMDNYLERTDLSVVEILDHGKGKFLSKDMANQYAQAKHLAGGICLNGERYAGGRGAVIWSDNGKPFIAPRETLWKEQKELVAARINSYHRDYTRIEGYTFVNLHPWTHSYEDVKWVVDNLDDDCVVITAEQMIDLISKNVAKKDVTTLANSGEKIVAPVDPLHNKFLLEAEDWTGNNLSLAQYGLKITSKATKSYKLPDLDSLVFELKYKAVNDSSFKVTAEIDGVEKIIADDIKATTKDGYNAFFLPFEAYFGSSYKGKDCKINITLNSGSGIIIDDVITSQRVPVDVESDGNLLVDEFSKTTEDWIFSNYEKNAFVKIKDEMLMIDGSDGWTGFFNRDVNNALFKRFTVPNGERVQFEMSLSGSSTGTDVKIQLICDGNVYDITNGFQYVDLRHENQINYLLENLGGKEAYIIIQQRDSNKNNGIGEIAFCDNIEIKSLDVNPSDNSFDNDMEDWDIDFGDAKFVEGTIRFTDNASIFKNYIFNNLDVLRGYRVVLNFKNASDNIKCKFQIFDGEEVIFTSDLYSCLDETFINIPALKQDLYTKKLTIKVLTEGTGSADLDRFQIVDYSTLDPYNNTFELGMEDWKQTNSTGASNSRVIRDANWPRLQFVYITSGSNVGSVEASKTYTLMEDRGITLEFDLEGNASMDDGNRGMCKIDLLIGEAVCTLFDEELPKGRETKSFRLDEIEALNDVAYEGKEVTIRMSIIKNGKANDGWLWGLKTLENK